MRAVRIPDRCPSCAGPLRVERLGCGRCGTRVEGCFHLPRLARLSQESREIVELLVLTSGSLKAVAKRLGISYPTIRRRLDEVIEELAGEVEDDERRRHEAIDRVATNEASADAVVNELREG